MNFLNRHTQLIFLFLIREILSSTCQKNPPPLTVSADPLAEENGMDGQQLQEAFITVEDIPEMKGLLVARNGVIVAKENFNQFYHGSLQDFGRIMKIIISI